MTSFKRPAMAVLAAVIASTLMSPMTLAAFAQTCGEWSQADPPAGATSAVLDVEARSATEAFAFASPLGLIQWDGTVWSQFPVPTEDLDAWSSVSFEKVALVGPTHVFLAGRGVNSPFSTDQILLFYDGTRWDHAAITLQPNIAGAPRNGAPNAVVGTTPDDLWILGIAPGTGDGVSGNLLLTVHWDGSRLTEYITPGPNNRQNNVHDGVAIASDDVWAVGGYNNTNNPDGRFRGLTYHWDGMSWSHVPNPSETIADVNLYTVAAIASDDVWAAGGHNATPFFMHWDGSAWSVVPSPATTGTIHEIAAIASDDVWAVDHAAQVPAIGKFYHWDGIRWSIVTPPEIPGATAVERHGGLAAVGACDVWAVGSRQIGLSVFPLIERLGASDVVGVPDSEVGDVFFEVSPNPTHGSTTIRSLIPGMVPQRVEIYDSRGRRVRTLPRTSSARGRLAWDGRDETGSRVPGGLYFVRVEASDGRAFTQKLAFVR